MRVTVPLAGLPPVTALTFRVRFCTHGCGLMNKVTAAVLPDVAERCAMIWLFTTLVFTGKVPLLWPAGIVILAGTVALPVSLPRVTSAPLLGAGADNVTVPVA